MAIYINTKTRNTIETDLVVSGGDWELVGEQQASDKEPTVPELKAKLDELGIDYDKKAKKPELLALLESAESNQDEAE
ncbi:HeH/LEM domain-containing protein [Streptococcus dysgalactiae]|uniref:HeH/LEM domain-containing protein n=1 Tax=Streptococcus dysgalactiae subsp. equisimilis TaxID=119602 RepID=A0AB38XZM6_STREQ|nr:HeH/LEM domain-containing protein [Streptococcus dysgalactiae]QBX23774.1 hypothetical protein Javan150_0033 [Streptococcus phage Javan150]KKC16947.1 hypothetical protein WH81_07195 [Streptococcus dysgalactiae subsp. equisimilis]TYK93765.1 hypothetical protein E0F69_00350 [Streptococcus dysgalactiae]WEQ88404.1 HeH/LEM domain-containing protein [Streptococcus dysgalactiae subsp. equisimilis]WHM78517.1 HeH/LEM domain-containing protein [Streptococcus dysgalactiae subsp. equisimilis]